MQCLTQLTPPTAVSHCVSLPFLSASANNLIVAKTSLLQVFSLKSIVSDAPDTASNTRSKVARKERVQTTKLVLVAQHELSGTVTGLARVKILRSKSGGEALLVALKDAKLSLVEWDPERYGLSTISIHFYEREDLQGIPWAPTVAQCVSHLTVDPSSRCAVLKFGARHIAILPFHQAGDDLVMGDLEPDTSSNPKSTDSPTKVVNGEASLQTAYGASFVLSLLALDPSLIHPIHLAFLHGYREPTFGVLSSQAAASSSLLHERQDPLSYTVYTLDMEQRESTTLLSITKLPYDLHTVLPLPPPIGGALLIGLNEIIHVDQSGKTNGVAVNEFALKNTEFSLPSEAHLGLRLEGCTIERLGAPNGDMLVVLRNGDLAILHFRIDGRSVSGLSVHPVEHSDSRVLSAGATCSASVGRGRIFIGSEDGDSVVLGWTSGSTKLKRQKSVPDLNLEEDPDTEDLLEDDGSEDEDDLYATEKVPGQAPVQSDSPMEDGSTGYSFRTHDKLVGLAPLADVKIVSAHPISKDDKEGTQQHAPKQVLLVTTGRGRASALTKLSPGIAPHMSKSYGLAKLEGAWSCTMKNADKTIVITSTLEESGEERSHAYDLSAGAVEELPNGDFDPTAGATVAIATLENGSRIVQVLKNEIRAYDEGKPVGTFRSSPKIYNHLQEVSLMRRSARLFEKLLALASNAEGD
jgi:cleavage and polyadenylation specificity factor subunit 1